MYLDVHIIRNKGVGAGVKRWEQEKKGWKQGKGCAGWEEGWGEETRSRGREKRCRGDRD